MIFHQRGGWIDRRFCDVAPPPPVEVDDVLLHPFWHVNHGDVSVRKAVIVCDFSEQRATVFPKKYESVSHERLLAGTSI